MDVHQLNFFELKVFNEVAKQRSLRSSSRNLGLQPAHLSKILQRIEQKIGAELLIRSNKGVSLTRAGLNFREAALEVLSSSDKLLNLSGKMKEQPILGVGSLSFLNSELLSPILAKLKDHRFRLMDLGPDQIVSTGIRGGFEIAIHVDKLEWPQSWHSQLIGTTHWVLIARQDHELPNSVAANELTEHPFVVPTYWSNEGFQVGNDHCPLSWNERRKGHESSTASEAVAIVANTDQLAFVPEIIARPNLQAGRIRVIEVTDWREFSKPIYLSVKADKIKKTLLVKLKNLLSKQLN